MQQYHWRLVNKEQEVAMAAVEDLRQSSSRYEHITQEELILRTELRVCSEHNIDKFHYPCRECHGGGKRLMIAIIREHLRVNSRDHHLMLSQVGGDPPGGYPTNSVWVDDTGHEWIFPNDEDEEEFRIPLNETEEFNDIFHEVQEQFMDSEHDIQQHLYDAFHVEDSDADIFDGIGDLYEQATTLVWGNSTVSVISATIVLMNMAVIHGCSNAFMDELLRYLSSSLLLGENQLPRGHYEAKKLIRKLGLAYDIIHACPSGCILYRNEYTHLNECPKLSCKKSRYISVSESLPCPGVNTGSFALKRT
jgi:hypothetical protein